MVSNVKFVGVTVLDLLAVLFIGLKITNQINWSWLWVLSPLWGQLLCYVIVSIGVFGFLVLAKMLAKQ